MMIFADMERPVSLEKVPAEWLDMLARQVDWAISELDEMALSDFPEPDQKHFELLTHQLSAFQHRLTLERVRRLAVFLDEQFRLGVPQSYLDEQEYYQKRKQKEEQQAEE